MSWEAPKPSPQPADLPQVRCTQPGGKYQPAVRHEQHRLWHSAALLDSDTPPVLLFAIPAIKKTDAAPRGGAHPAFHLSKHCLIN